MVFKIFDRDYSVFHMVIPSFLITYLLIVSGWSLLYAQDTKQPLSNPAATPQTAPAQKPPDGKANPPQKISKAGNAVSLNFNRADLVEIIHVLAQHLKLTYTIDPDVKGTVTIHTPEPVKEDDLFPVFNQILRANGAIAIKTGEVYRISTIEKGKGLASPMGTEKEGGYTIEIVPIRFFAVAEMKRLLLPFLTQGGEIAEYPRGNFLVIMDLPSNIQRLIEIKDLIDINVFVGTRMEIYQPKGASAEELAEEMNKIMRAFGSSAVQAEGFAAQFVPLPRINQLLVISHSDAAWAYVKRWLDRIDTIGEGPGRRVFVYPVENGKATDLAEILGQVLGLTSGSKKGTHRTLRELHSGGTPASKTPGEGKIPSVPGIQPQPPKTYDEDTRPIEPAAPGVLKPSEPETGSTTSPQGIKSEEQIRIVPDPATNSLIIYGTAQEFQGVKNILKELDIMPRQVLMEVLIAEVTLTDDLRFGIEYEILRKGDSFTDLIPVIPVQISGGLNAVAGTGKSSVRAFINTLVNKSKAKVLSSPTVLATDNQPARIQVGSEEPIATGQQTSIEGGTLTTTVQYRNTGRILTIIPQVNSQGLVNLQIKAEVSERGTEVTVGRDTFPSFETRDAETTAVVQDGETLFIGGIINERKTRSRAGVPLLMDIPILGYLFGVTTNSVERTELVMLITPHVIRNSEEARSVTEEFKERLQAVTQEIERAKKESQQKEERP